MPAEFLPFLQIEPTTRCNFTCGFCAGRSLPQIDMDFDYFCALLDAVTGLRHVELQGEGEPLMHPRFFDMLRYINDKHPQAHVSFITNGSLFTQDNIRRILACRVHRIVVSLESADYEEFQRIRGGKLQKVEKGIQNFMAARNAAATIMPTVGLAVTILRSTADQMGAIGALYQILGLDGGIMTQALQSMPCYTRFYSASMKAEIPDRNTMLQVRNMITSDKPLAEIFANNAATGGFYQDLFGSVKEPRQTCAWLESGLYVAADATVCSCCFVKDSCQDGYGRVSSIGLPALMAARQQTLASLKNGETPHQCRQCSIARNIHNSGNSYPRKL